MLYIYPETVESVRKFVNKKWPDKNKEVYCQENESAWHQNRYILITVSPRINFKVVHYEYINGYLELHLEDDYYGNTFNQRLYKYLRDNIDTESGDYLWHNWNGMKQGRLRYEYKIGDLLELADYLTKFISKIDPLIEDFLNTYYDGNNDTQKEIFTVSSIDFNKIEDGASVNINITDGTGSKVVLHTMSLKDVLSLKLKIPDYQRIYCWPQKNVEQLLDDIFIPRNHKYHLGTLILQKKGDDYEQYLGKREKIDEWFDTKTKGLSSVARAALKERWAKMEKLFSSKERIDRIVADICQDMSTKRALAGGYGNAMLVADSIYQACRYWEVFQSTELKGHCAVVTSYDASTASVKDEYQGDGETEDLTKYEVYQKMIGDKTPEQFETWAKKEFTDHPGDMKLLIVVDKLLTGFDAPSATYLYIDKKMRDHNLFQAICRVNRVDSEEKDFGYIIDYQDLFGAVKSAIEDYTNGAFDGYDDDDIEGLLSDRLTEGRKALEESLQAVYTMCEVIHPQTREGYFAYFVYAETTPVEDQQKECEENANKRETFYKLVSRLVRRYIDIANEMEQAGYTTEEAADIKKQVDYFNDIKDEIKLKSGDALDLKYYDPAMRQLIDNYVRAEDSEKLVDLADISFLDLIDTQGDKAIDSLPKKIKQNERSVAEILAANMRKMIISERPNNPAYFDKMSDLLNHLLQEQKDGKIQYKELIKKLIEKLKEARSTIKTKYPATIDTKGKQALYDNLGKDETLALRVHETIKANARDGFRDMDSSGLKKMKALRRAVERVLQGVEVNIDDIMQLIVAQREY